MRIGCFIKSNLFVTKGMEWRDNIACVSFMNERKSGWTVSYANIYYEGKQLNVFNETPD